MSDEMHACPACGIEYADDVLMKLRAENDLLQIEAEEARRTITLVLANLARRVLWEHRVMRRMRAGVSAKDYFNDHFTRQHRAAESEAWNSLQEAKRIVNERRTSRADPKV